jgi:hypothetical protein
MKTTTATAILTIMFLSAGAFAGNTSKTTQITGNSFANVTVILKNSQWPVRAQLTTDTCAQRRCIEI